MFPFALCVYLGHFKTDCDCFRIKLNIRISFGLEMIYD